MIARNVAAVFGAAALAGLVTALALYPELSGGQPRPVAIGARLSPDTWTDRPGHSVVLRTCCPTETHTLFERVFPGNGEGHAVWTLSGAVPELYFAQVDHCYQAAGSPKICLSGPPLLLGRANGVELPEPPGGTLIAAFMAIMLSRNRRAQ